MIEDAAQAHGATWQGRRAGSFGAAACFSFYPGKNLGAFGDAGAVVTSDPTGRPDPRAARSRPDERLALPSTSTSGRNSRMDALQAVVLSAKLARIEAWNDRRQPLAARYRAR